MTLRTYSDAGYSTLHESLAQFLSRFAGASLKIYDGTRPATGAAITTQNLLATLTFSAAPIPTAFSSDPLALVANLIVPPSVSAAGTGTATWFRVTVKTTSPYGGLPSYMAGATVMDGDVGTSGADLNLSTVAFTPGMTVTITAFPISIVPPP